MYVTFLLLLLAWHHVELVFIKCYNAFLYVGSKISNKYLKQESMVAFFFSSKAKVINILDFVGERQKPKMLSDCFYNKREYSYPALPTC